MKDIERLYNQHQANKAQLEKERQELAEVQARLEAAKLAQQTLEGIAEQVRLSAHQMISAIVTRCLSAVFDQPYEFAVVFERKRGTTEARLIFRREGHEVDPTDAAGGGVLDVASFALRLAALLLSKPPRRKLLVLDEPFKFLSAQYHGRVRQLIDKLSTETGVQFVIVTHIEALKLGTVVEISDAQ